MAYMAAVIAAMAVVIVATARVRVITAAIISRSRIGLAGMVWRRWRAIRLVWWALVSIVWRLLVLLF